MSRINKALEDLKARERKLIEDREKLKKEVAEHNLKWAKAIENINKFNQHVSEFIEDPTMLIQAMNEEQVLKLKTAILGPEVLEEGQKSLEPDLDKPMTKAEMQAYLKELRAKEAEEQAKEKEKQKINEIGQQNRLNYIKQFNELFQKLPNDLQWYLRTVEKFDDNSISEIGLAYAKKNLPMPAPSDLLDLVSVNAQPLLANFKKEIKEKQLLAEEQKDESTDNDSNNDKESDQDTKTADNNSENNEDKSESENNEESEDLDVLGSFMNIADELNFNERTEQTTDAASSDASSS